MWRYYVKAYPTDDPRIFKIKGNKIFITWGDNDFTENIIHLYLARVEGAREGTKGISLFIVPKYWVNEDGSLGPLNDVQTTGVEHKLGQAGSCTAALAFGEENQCRGILLGVNPGKRRHRGRNGPDVPDDEWCPSANWTAARSCLANAYYNARDYARDRIQGRPLTNPKGERVSIINHEDIRRTL